MKSFCSRVRHSQSLLVAVLASSAVFTAGCANMATTVGGSSFSNDAASIGGRIHGGNQPVSNANITLWFAGQGSSPALAAATTTSANDGAGSFSFVKAPDGTTGTTGNTFACPAAGAGNPYVYVIASGGNTLNNGDGGINNTAAVFVAPFGLCKSITPSSFVDMTEVTTVATMAALQQYFNPSPTSSGNLIAQSFNTGGSGLSYLAMGNAFALIPNLVNAATGTAVTSKTIAGSTAGGGVGAGSTSLVATPETAKINTIANILASCINNASPSAPACTALFANASPGDPTTTSQPGATFSAPTNTLQAAYYMLTNPTNGSTTKLATLFGLSPAAGAPFQPTLASAPSDWTIAISYASTSTCGSASGHLFNSAQGLAADAYGGVWIANNEPGVGNLSYLNATGAPATCVHIGSGANSGITIDDATGLADIWLADSGSTNVYRYHPTDAATAAVAFPTTTVPMAITADGTGNIFYTSPSDATLYEIPGAVAAGSAVAPVAIATGIGSSPTGLLVDSAAAVWSTSGSTFITRTSSSTPNTGTGFTSTQITTVGPTSGIAVTAFTGSPAKNSLYFSAAGSENSVSLFQGSGTSYASAPLWPVAGLSTPAAVAADGAQNVWVINNGPGANSIVEIGAAKQQLSPSTGFQKGAAYLGSGRSLAIDISGNVWIGQDGTNSITEIVGAAVPVYQPFAVDLRSGGFQQMP